MLVSNPRSSKNSKKSGQAMIEFLPAILLFFVIIGASIIFFVGLRESFHTQIAARNALFAKIRNSGPLVSPSDGALGYSEHYVFPFTGTTTNPGVSQNNVCFTAVPESSVTQAVLPKILGLSLNLDRAHRATIFRKPGASNSCDNI